MEEENQEKEKIEKRGRPKKNKDIPIENVQEEPIEKSEDELNNRIKILEEVIQDMKSKSKLIPNPVGDVGEYPNKEEQEILENRVEPPPIKMPEDTSKAKSLWSKIFKKNKVKKNNTILVWLLQPTGRASIHYIETEDDGDFRVGDEKYNANEHCIYYTEVKNVLYPTCLLPTWSMIPIGTRAWFELSTERRLHELERIILRSIKKEEAVKEDDQKKKGKGLSGKTIWILIALVVGGYFILKFIGVL